MIKHNFKLIIRGLKKNTIVSSINIMGLVIGFTFVILTGKYVYTEKTFDHFHKNHRSVSRIEWKTSDSPVRCYTPGIMHQWLKNNIPEVEYTTRVANDEGFGGMERNILYNQTKFKINNPLMVDVDFFTMFSFKTLKGETESFKTDKYVVALTGPIAAKIFGNEDPIGKTISYKGELFVVRAIMEGVPANSSIQFEMLLPIENLQGVGSLQNWRNNCLQTYIQADSRISLKVLQQKIHDGIVAQFKSLGYTNEASERHFFLNPLDNIYYTENLNDSICIHGNSRITSLLLALSVLVLLIALFNYTNASLANASESLKGVGIKSISGASRTNNVGFIIWQSVIPCVFAMVIAVFLSLFTEDFIIQALNIPLVKLNFFQHITIIGAGMLLGILVGIYPSIKLTSYKVTDSLKKREISGQKAINVGNVFSVAQFAASIVLIISVFTIYKQISFILKQSGDNLDKDVVMYMPLANRTEHKAHNIIAIQDALKLLPEIKGVSTSLSLPGDEFYSDFSGFPLENNGEKSSVDVSHDMVDAGYPEVMGLKIVEGRAFDASLKADVNTYLVNEAFIKKYQVHDISAVQLNGAPIIGVVKDFHYNSLYKEIKPLAMLYSDQYQSHIVIRLAPMKNVSLSEIVKKINRVVDGIDNSAISEVHFLDQHIETLYDREIKVSKVLFIMALFSILISCMGLFSMSLFIVKKRTKEIGIRKVNGARISEVMIILNRDFIKWVAIAFVIATPISWYAMVKWLENFAYKTELSWWIFALAGFLALGIALLTVSWQSWKAATRNPVEALRYE